MKKLMIAAAIVCAAVVSQAASMNWGCDYSYASDGSGEAGADRGTTAIYSAYVFDALAYTTFAEDVAKDGIASVLANKSIGSYQMTNGTKADGKINGATDGFSGTTEAQAFMVLIDGATIADAKNYFVSETATGSIPQAQGAWGTITFGEDGDLLASADAGNWKAMSAVPEPTSGLLLLLGVAGLALRRRRA